MNRTAITAIVIALLVVVGGGIILATRNSSSNKSASTSENMPMDQSSSGNTSTKAETATNSVIIENFAFSPANITVKKGTTVTWTNKDSATHTVTGLDNNPDPASGAANLPNSGNLASGKSYSFTFLAAGTYQYKCSIHPSMTGTVTVTD